MTGEVPGLEVGGWGVSKLKGVFLGLAGSLYSTGGGGRGVVYDYSRAVVDATVTLVILLLLCNSFEF